MIIFNVMLSRNIDGSGVAFLDFSKSIEQYSGYRVINITSSFAKINSDIQSIKLPNFSSNCILSKIYLNFLIKKYKPSIILIHSARAAKFIKIFTHKIKNAVVIGVAHSYKNRALLQKSDQLIVPSEHMLKYFVTCGFANNNIHIVANMINVTENYVARNYHKQLTIGGLGALTKTKGFEYLLQSISILINRGYKIKLLIGGSGKNKQFLQKLSKMLKIDNSVVFLGYVDKKEFFQQIDIFCLPSIYESFGIVVLEAVMCSVPVVVTNSYGPTNIIEDRKNGLVAKPKSGASLAKNLEILINNQELSQEYSKLAYQKLCTEYAMPVVGKKITSLLQKIKNNI
ncbi:glycosyltransferase family 1 protein [Rickettsia endosymbiont of Cardiosporidium cionae]|nr:glycosyltransferase family 1 protein [Rickettsia endosymbiont of Cardiosporidium cionae]